MTYWRNLSLSVRLPVAVVFLMVAVGLLASQLVLAALDRQQADRIRELARQHVQALSVALGPHVLRKDVWEVYDTLERAAGASQGRRTLFSAVANSDGRILAATDPRRAPIDGELSALSDGAVAPDALSVSRDVKSVKLMAPLVYQGRQVGEIMTELDISDLVAERRDAGRTLVLGNALATGVLALLGYIAVLQMLRPVSQLVSRMSDTEGEPDPYPSEEIPEGDGEMARLVRSYNAMVTAVAEKADAERRLAERERLASLGRLTSSLAHEINNPLGGLMNATDTIRTYPDKPEVVRQSAELLHRGLGHLRDVAKAALDTSRLDSDLVPLGEQDFEDLHLLIEPEIRIHQQRLDWRVRADGVSDANLPAAPVRQIALNLMLNATRAAGRDGVVSFRASVDDETLLLVVSDTGPGFTPGARARLLDEENDSPSRGVGLRMVRDLTSRLSGRIDIAREQGVTSVTVTLPFGTGATEGC